MKNISIAILIVALISCSNTAAKKQTEAELQTEKQPIQIQQEQLKTLPQEIRNLLAEQTTNVEATMYDTGGSFSLNDAKSTKQFINLLLEEPPAELSTHQTGHIMFLNNGNEIAFFTVYKLGEKAYAKYTNKETKENYYNLLGEQAVNMFLNLRLQTK